MPIELNYNESDGYAVARLSGLMVPREFDEMLCKIAASPDIPSRVPLLSDLRDLDFAKLTAEDMNAFLSVKSRHPERYGLPAAVLVSNSVGYGMVRLFLIRQDAAQVSDESLTEIFDDEETARRWMAIAATQAQGEPPDVA